MHRPSGIDRFKFSVALIAVAALGVVGTLYAVDRFDRKLDSRPDWPTVQGTVLSLETSESLIHRVGEDTLKVSVTFEYAVGGQNYSGEQQWDEGCGEVVGECRRARERYRLQYLEGAPVPVYYNPADPRDAVVRTHFGWPVGWLVLAIASGVVGVLGTAGALVLQFEPSKERRWFFELHESAVELGGFIQRGAGIIAFLLLLPATLPFKLISEKRATERTKRWLEPVRLEHPEVLGPIALILFDSDPLHVSEVDMDEYDGEATRIISRLDACSGPEDVGKLLRHEFPDAEAWKDKAEFETVANKIWDAWQKRGNW